jgi:hypothetical protein
VSVFGIRHSAAVDRLVVDNDDALDGPVLGLEQEQCMSVGTRRDVDRLPAPQTRVLPAAETHSAVAFYGASRKVYVGPFLNATRPPEDSLGGSPEVSFVAATDCSERGTSVCPLIVYAAWVSIGMGRAAHTDAAMPPEGDPERHRSAWPADEPKTRGRGRGHRPHHEGERREGGRRFASPHAATRQGPR